MIEQPIRLHARGRARSNFEPALFRATRSPAQARTHPEDYALVIDSDSDFEYHPGTSRCILAKGSVSANGSAAPHSEVIAIDQCDSLDHLADGDVVRVSPSGRVDTRYRIQSAHNTLFATARCNSYCVMCSQPPKSRDDSWLVEENLRLISLMDPSTRSLGITGGEPTLFKDDLIRLITACRECLPETTLHVLTNGRLFYYRTFAERVSGVQHPRLTLAIPLYSDLDSEHDFVVQARGAFAQTMVGIHNLGLVRIPIEIRMVIHAFTARRLRQFAHFIIRNLPFVSHVALMGLEIMGFAKENIEDLWIDPVDYQKELEAAVVALDRFGIPVSVYNHQHCVLPESLWRFATRSISDWKNVYFRECDDCSVRDQCGGFFASSVIKRSRATKAVH